MDTPPPVMSEEMIDLKMYRFNYLFIDLKKGDVFHRRVIRRLENRTLVTSLVGVST